MMFDDCFDVKFKINQLNKCSVTEFWVIYSVVLSVLSATYTAMIFQDFFNSTMLYHIWDCLVARAVEERE